MDSAPAPILTDFCVAGQFINPSICQCIRQVIFRMAAMSLDPLPLNTVPGYGLVQALPEINILDRLPGCRFPTPCFPVIYPLGNSVHHVFGIRGQNHFTAPLETLQTHNRSHQLHTVIRRHGFTAIEVFFRAVIAQYHAPTPGAGITSAGAVGVDFGLNRHDENCADLNLEY